jgi:hypothetical protein
MIASHLSNVSTTSLALTCRTLYSMCFSRHVVLGMAEKEKLLLLLEKDVAALYFCDICVKLHCWHGRWDRTITPSYAEHMPCKQRMSSCVFFPFISHIPYNHARLVMNRHFYGSAHGPPLHTLTQAESFRDLDGVDRTYSDCARIVDNQLLMLSRLSASHPQGDSMSLRRSVNFWGPRVCEHLILEKRYPNYIPMQLPEIAEEEHSPTPFSLCDQSLGSCASCMTDYNISISWQSERKGYIIELSIYRQLGDCRSPFAWSWHSMTVVGRQEEPRITYLSDNQPGCVRDQWNKADGVISRTRGDWVGESMLAAMKPGLRSRREIV